MKPTRVINLLSGPGAGKSTLAAELFVKMKQLGVSCELVREYVKDWAWDGRKINGFDQFYIFGKQTRKESMLYGKVDYVITDAPIWLGGFYGEHYENTPCFTEMCEAYYVYCDKKGIEHYNFVIQRNKPYDARGRYEDETQAKEVDRNLLAYLDRHAIYYSSVNLPDTEKADHILTHFGILT